MLLSTFVIPGNLQISRSQPYLLRISVVSFVCHQTRWAGNGKEMYNHCNECSLLLSPTAFLSYACQEIESYSSKLINRQGHHGHDAVLSQEMRSSRLCVGKSEERLP